MQVDAILGRITPGLKGRPMCKDCDLIVEAAFEDIECKEDNIRRA